MSVRADGTDPRSLTASTGGNRSPDVSPDGRRLAFISTRDGNPEIYEMDAEGGEARRHHQDIGERESSPRWLPNGDLIYVVDKGGGARADAAPAGATGPHPGAARSTSRSWRSTSRRTASESPTWPARSPRPGKGKSQLTLRIQPLAAGSTPTLVPAPARRAGAEPVVLTAAVR